MFNLCAKVNDKVVFERESDYQTGSAAMNFLHRYVKQNFPLESADKIEYVVERR